MNGATYPLDLFTLLQKYKERVVQQEETFNGARGLVIGMLISFALYAILLSIGLIIF